MNPLQHKLEKIAAKILSWERARGLHADVVFVGPKEIRRLNRLYRGKDKATDVLSFRQIDQPHVDKHFLGEIILCRSYIKKQAAEYGVPYEEELIRMTIHGALHLLNYDHIKPADAKKMLPLQEKYLSAIL